MSSTYPRRRGTQNTVSPLLLSGLCLGDTHELPHLRAFLFKLHVPVFLGEQRMVAAATDVGAGVETRAALANDDVARHNLLATIDLDA